MRPLNFGKLLEKLDEWPKIRPNADQAGSADPVSDELEIRDENGKTNNPAALTATAYAERSENRVR
ncbi:hypothetical protein SAE02_68730 [Skermanella aerolata]|uniref:Uncharacterized protein n=1 Tax=Skermanella aerolata TaxID=393310 RepID=A0A512E1Y2_9PROT|nr:hypothetical protein SAE02_68730 [Skermanella aerolata]